MDSKNIIREIMKKEGYTQGKLAVQSGMKGQANVTGVLNRYASMRVDTFDKFVRAMGWKIVVMPEGVNVRENWYEVTEEQTAPCADE